MTAENTDEKKKEHFYTEKARRQLERSRHSYMTVLCAPVHFGKLTFARDCAEALEREVMLFPSREDEQKRMWEQFLQFLFEGRVPEAVEGCRDFCLNQRQRRIIMERMQEIWKKRRQSGKPGIAVVFGGMERVDEADFYAFLCKMGSSPVPGWRFFFLYNERENYRRDELSRSFLTDIAEKSEVLVVEAEDLRLHAEDIYDYFLLHRIPVTIEAVVSLQRHSDGAIGEIAEVLQLQLRGKAGNVQKLTRREQEIASMASQGLTNREIAERLYISENTVKSAMKSIFYKLKITSRRKLIGSMHPENSLNFTDS